MKKRVIIFILTIFCFQYGFSKINMKMYQEAKENIIKSNPSVEGSYQYLITTSEIGYDYNDIYLGIILKDKNVEELLKKLLKKLFKEAHHNAAKINALIGLNYLNSSYYNTLKKELEGNVTLFHGCYSFPQSLNFNF